ncbi:TetR/AcrR family transcriptional regulator [Nocardiopsis sp. RSe5-2]|uniref:TetR/AcrR family transcriptional regulator n=1 Tax=Nocardiopsis endophytica TaxID=3018445 RepID=A0ABT4U8S6_9ACTN|nr:TetR/AcrR family transcriptional regulator [Nocardiopsis endophytica]MDA2813353.1 TetR/AcrR family transcriptional regulator [Nocardiopsis endophytica]
MERPPMDPSDTPRAAGRAPGGHPAKRAAIDAAARTVFGNEGYSRASVDAIAAEAGVSKRTIYNHHRDKAQLFLTVLQQSARAVAEYHEGLIDRHLGTPPPDLAAALTRLGHGLAVPHEDFAGHFALVRVIFAEARHLPEHVLQGWRETGPGRVHSRLAERMGALAEEGGLSGGPPEELAAHFTQLVASEVYERSFHGALPLPQEETDALIASGVAAFLALHGPR